MCRTSARLSARRAKSETTAESLPPLNETLTRMGHQLAASQQRLDAFAKALEAGNTADVERLAPPVAATVDNDLASIRRAVEHVLVRLVYLGKPWRPDSAEELLLVRLRETAGRYATRYRLFLNSQQSIVAGDLKTSDPALLRGDLQRLHGLQKVNTKNVDAIREQYADGSLNNAEERRKYTVLRQFHRTGRFLQTAADLTERSDPAAAARALLAEFPDAGLEVLAANIGLADAAEDALAAAARCLQAADLDIEPYHAALAGADRDLQRLRRVLVQIGSQDDSSRLLDRVDALLVKTAQQQFSRDRRPDSAAVSAKRFALDSLSRQLATFANELRLTTDARAEDESGFRGGPPGIWSGKLLIHASRSRERLLAQIGHARQAFIRGVQAAVLPDEADPAHVRRSWAWAALLFRLYRSDLYGIGGIELQQTDTDEQGDPHLRFLQAELEEALKVRTLKNYDVLTREYLRTLKDFLRY